MNGGKDDVLIKVYDNNLHKIVDRYMSELIPEMVAAQINIDFEFEAIKAQTIIARTMLVRKSKIFGGKGCRKYQGADFCLEGHCGKWISKEDLKERLKEEFDKYWNKLLKAEEETKSLIITFNNKVIEPKYHSTCGGATDNSENVENHKVIYLRRVLCDFCKSSPYWKNIKDLSIDEIEEKLNIRLQNTSPFSGPSISNIIEEVERDESGRIVKIKIGDKVFKGTEVKECLGLDSTRFGWIPVIFRFETRGKGHGLGLCQYGANEMAKTGKTAEEIINYYYTGIDIKPYEKPSKNKPLIKKVIVIDPGHGGEENTGVIGNAGIREKDICLSIAVELRRILQGLGADVVLTREKDEYVPLSIRARKTNEIRPDFFISIHMNSFANPNISGTEIYHYRGDKEGEILSNFIIEKISENLQTINRGVRIADFYLLKEVKTSSIHIELAYLTNPEDERKFVEEKYVKLAASSIAEGIIEYYTY